ncbi:hypothetical protein IAT40_000903 [Kwoniella sp. CBS 6097]
MSSVDDHHTSEDDGAEKENQRHPFHFSSFEVLLSLPSPKEDDESTSTSRQHEPIYLEFSDVTISLFLDIATSHRPCLPPLGMARAKELLDLTEFTISEDFIKLAYAAVLVAYAQKPFELLVLASDRNDVPMARQALGKIGPSTLKLDIFDTSSTILTPADKNNFHAFLERLNPSFRSELLTIYLECGEVRQDRYTTLRPGLFLRDDWSYMAEKFNPSV